MAERRRDCLVAGGVRVSLRRGDWRADSHREPRDSRSSQPPKLDGFQLDRTPRSRPFAFNGVEAVDLCKFVTLDDHRAHVDGWLGHDDNDRRHHARPNGRVDARDVARRNATLFKPIRALYEGRSTVDARLFLDVRAENAIIWRSPVLRSIALSATTSKQDDLESCDRFVTPPESNRRKPSSSDGRLRRNAAALIIETNRSRETPSITCQHTNVRSLRSPRRRSARAP